MIYLEADAPKTIGEARSLLSGAQVDFLEASMESSREKQRKFREAFLKFGKGEAEIFLDFSNLIGSDGELYDSVAFLVSTVFVKEGSRYFSNGVFAICAEEYHETMISIMEQLKEELQSSGS